VVAQPLQCVLPALLPGNQALNHAAFWLPCGGVDCHRSTSGVDPFRGGDPVDSGPSRDVTLTVQRWDKALPWNAFTLRQRCAREVMRPRNEIVGLDTEASLTECLALAQRTRYSRFPLCEGGDLDKTLGSSTRRTLWPCGTKPDSAVTGHGGPQDHLRPGNRTAGKKLLSLFLQRKQHFALVVV